MESRVADFECASWRVGRISGVASAAIGLTFDLVGIGDPTAGVVFGWENGGSCAAFVQSDVDVPAARADEHDEGAKERGSENTDEVPLNERSHGDRAFRKAGNG